MFEHHVNINVNAPDGAGPGSEQPSAQLPTHVRPRPDMPAHCRSRLTHRGARREPPALRRTQRASSPPPCVQVCSPRGPLR
eukprot:7058684-Prymnesium_polylepis.1